MYSYVAVIMGLYIIIVGAAPPLQITIDCGSQETDSPSSILVHRVSTAQHRNQIDVDSICSTIHKALPQSVHNGKFVVIGQHADQSHASNDLAPVVLPPPKVFVPRRPRITIPNLKLPKLQVPVLKSSGSRFAPRVGAPMHFYSLRARQRDEHSSAERIEKFKKGVQKMLHVVKVLGEIDQYLSVRARSVIDVISKAFKDRAVSNYDY